MSQQGFCSDGVWLGNAQMKNHLGVRMKLVSTWYDQAASSSHAEPQIKEDMSKNSRLTLPNQ